MSQSSPRTGWTVLLLAGALCLSGAAISAEPAAAEGPNVYDLMDQGRLALRADKYAEAARLFEQALGRPDFVRVDQDLQYFTFLLASFAADGTDDNLSEHEYLVAATVYPKADAETWLRRARVALVLEKFSDSALALTTVAKKWPKEIKATEFHAWLVNKTVYELGKNSTLHAQRSELLGLLYEAGYKTQYDIEPSHLWLTLATDALDRKDLRRAREIVRRITDNAVLVSMRIDKRFDALTASEPGRFEVRAAAERQAKHLKKVMKENPKSLGAVVQYGYALFTLGRFDEMLDIANVAIDKTEKAPRDKPPYEDLDASLNWIHNHKALALRSLGRWDEAVEVLASWERSDRNKEDKVSQAINLGSFYTDIGRPDDALRSVESLDWSRGMSDYGRTQCQQVRFRAYLQKGMDSQVNEIVQWIREHQEDSMATAQSILLEVGDVDGAAALLVSRLRDVEERATALAEVQNYQRIPRTELGRKFDELNESMLARPEVAAAIADVGRREKFPVYSILY